MGARSPMDDRKPFAELMLCWEMRSYRIAEQGSGTVVFDRGAADVVAYLRLCGLPVSGHMLTACDVFRYNRIVFVAPPWPQIFRQGRERKQDFGEAVRTYESAADTYPALQYELVEIPRFPVEERVQFLIDKLFPTRRK
jgi:predicted ATPase